ncbi:MAG: tellurite resistance TerB family protein [Parvibaculaceae bacterium]
MIDAQKLLDQFLGGGNAGRGDPRQGAARQNGGLGDIAGRLGGLSGGMGGLAGGAVAGSLAAILLGSKGGRKLAKNAVTMGGMAVLGGIAYKAYRDWQASKGMQSTVPPEPQGMKDVTPAPEGTPFLPAPEKERNALGLALITAMIAAAKADGHIDAAEQQKIFGRIDQAGLGAEEKAFLMDELRKPLDIDAVVKAATSTEVAAEIYAASVLAIDPDDPAEQAYLSMLASRLKLDPGLKANIEAEVARV